MFDAPVFPHSYSLIFHDFWYNETDIKLQCFIAKIYHTKHVLPRHLQTNNVKSMFNFETVRKESIGKK